MKDVTREQLLFLNKVVLKRKISKKDLDSVIERLRSGSITLNQYYLELAFSSDFLRSAAKNIMEYHLYFLHFARIKAIASLLPQADVIVDLGGANGSIYEMGYPHKFKKIIVVDLPPEQRDDMYKTIELKKTDTPNGPIHVHFGDMSNLKFLKSNSVDLVWSGESIEHIEEEAGIRTLNEAMRVLKPGGYLCLDTPNRFITEIHTAWRGGDFIHPEHKIEYYPKQIQKMIKQAGFVIEEARGIREMPHTFQTKVFDYSELVTGKDISDDPTKSYMQYYKCRKPQGGNNLKIKLKNTALFRKNK